MFFLWFFSHLSVPLSDTRYRLRFRNNVEKERTHVRKIPNKFGFSLTYPYLCTQNYENNENFDSKWT